MQHVNNLMHLGIKFWELAENKEDSYNFSKENKKT